MALQCQLTISAPSATVGQSPAPMLLLQAYNATAAAIVVTGVSITFWDTVGNQLRQAPAVPPSVPFGPGQSYSVAAASSSFFGPFPIQVSGAMSGNPYFMVPTSSQPTNIQPSQPLQTTFIIGATILASDGSINEAGRVQLVVSSQSQPPALSQGGSAQMYNATNSGLVPAFVG